MIAIVETGAEATLLAALNEIYAENEILRKALARIRSGVRDPAKLAHEALSK